ncbi:hypothetical protein AB0I24_15515 [Brachybacterium paraconglomeratum]
MTYQHTRREAGMTAESVVGPLRTFEEARSAVSRTSYRAVAHG